MEFAISAISAATFAVGARLFPEPGKLPLLQPSRKVAWRTARDACCQPLNHHLNHDARGSVYMLWN